MDQRGGVVGDGADADGNSDARTRGEPPGEEENDSASLRPKTLSVGTSRQISELKNRRALNLSHQVGVKEHGLSYYLNPAQTVWDETKIKEAASTDGRILSCLWTALKGAFPQPSSEKSTSCLPSLPTELQRALQDRKARKRLVDQIIVGLNRSTILHLAAGAEAQFAVELCQLLVDHFDADFDYIRDGAGRNARTIAIANKNLRMSKWAQSLGTLYGRYVVNSGPPIHKSATCEVKFATDNGDTAGEERRQVALKIMSKREHFDHELEVRLVHKLGSGKDIPPDLNRFDRDLAVELYRYHDEVDKKGREMMCLVMPRADRSLDEIIRYEHVAGRELHLIRHVATSVARALLHLHSERQIMHGDLKTRNIVRLGSRFELIDFDSALRIGDPVRVQKVSSAYCSPELGRVLFGSSRESLEALKHQCDVLKQDLQALKSPRLRSLCQVEIIATEGKIEQLQVGKVENLTALPTMDIWSFGIIMYQMLTGSSVFKCYDTDSLDGVEEERRLVHWQGLRSSHLRRVLANCPGVTGSEIRAAKQMLQKCLMQNPQDRPQSMAEILHMPFLNCPDGYDWTPKERNCIRVIFSDPLVYYSEKDGICPIDRLNFEREREMIVQSIRSTGKNIEVSFDAATAPRLQELADTRCGCLHFSGHGHPSFLVFEDGSGGAHFLNADGLQRLLPGRESFKFIFVSACNSKDIGGAFVEAGVPHVLCCERDSLLMDNAAADFARSFYGELAKGSTIKTAFDSAAGLVLVSEGKVESMKYTLLPCDSNHDVSIFDADDAGDFEEEIKQEVRPLPAAPVGFVGHQEKLYQIVSAVLSGEEKKHTIFLIGENGSLRNNLVSAAFYYVKHRLSTSAYVNEIYYISRSGDESLVTALYHQLSGKGRMANEKDQNHFVCQAIKGSRVLIIVDGIDVFFLPSAFSLLSLFVMWLERSKCYWRVKGRLIYFYPQPRQLFTLTHLIQARRMPLLETCTVAILATF